MQMTDIIIFFLMQRLRKEDLMNPKRYIQILYCIWGKTVLNVKSLQ